MRNHPLFTSEQCKTIKVDIQRRQLEKKNLPNAAVTHNKTASEKQKSAKYILNFVKKHGEWIRKQKFGQQYIRQLERDKRRVNQYKDTLSLNDLLRIRRSQNNQCVFCGIHLNTLLESKEDMDHIIPKSRGGNNFPDNIEIICEHCNAVKGTLTFDEFVEKIEKFPFIIKRVKKDLFGCL